MSLIKKLAGETAIYGISSILSRLLNWIILTPYFTRVFAKGEYGIVSDLYTWIALLLVFYTYRMETAFFRYGRQKENFDVTFSTASLSILGTTFIFTTALFLFAQPIATWLKYPEHPEYVFWFIGIVAADALSSIPFARLRLLNRPIRFAALKTLNILINILFVFFFLEACPWLIEGGWTWLKPIYNPENRIAYVFISNFLASAMILLALLPMYFRIKFQQPTKDILDLASDEATIQSKVFFDKELWQKMIFYSLPLVISAIAAVVNQLIGGPMIKYLASDDLNYNLEQAGIFSAASKLAVLMNLFTQAFNYAAEPFFFRHADREDSKQIYAQVANAFAIVGSVVFLGIMLYLDIIQYFLGEDFREGLGILPIMLIANLFLGLYYSMSIWFKLSDNTGIGGYIAIGGSIITLLVNFIFIPNPAVGYFAPAWASLACYGFMLGACYVLGQRYFPIAYPIGRMLIYVLLAIILYALSEWAKINWSGNRIILSLFNTALFVLYLLVLFRMEKNFFRYILKGKSA
ncbi:MAG: oligosaccharide flippase family protein [Saprospiraceae bacterium]|nr:oligosaccharide flippase family protein [Saprospiraceae bacterium]